MPLPPERMRLWRGGCMRKRWRYVGVYDEELMLCAGRAWIGPLPQTWWALWDRGARRLDERTRLLSAGRQVQLSDDRVLVSDGDVRIDLELRGGEAIEVVTPYGGAYAWTRKRAPAVSGHVRAGGREWTVTGTAVVDDSDGYHPRRTAWRWSAGSGRLADGRNVAWNLVEGIHDSPHDSERTLWLDGAPHELEPVRFSEDLSAVAFVDGAELTFDAEATRRRDDDVRLLRSRYEQPFGTFAGAFPAGLELARGYGVMERHEALW